MTTDPTPAPEVAPDAVDITRADWHRAQRMLRIANNPKMARDERYPGGLASIHDEMAFRLDPAIPVTYRVASGREMRGHATHLRFSPEGIDLIVVDRGPTENAQRMGVAVPIARVTHVEQAL